MNEIDYETAKLANAVKRGWEFDNRAAETIARTWSKATDLGLSIEVRRALMRAAFLGVLGGAHPEVARDAADRVTDAMIATADRSPF